MSLSIREEFLPPQAPHNVKSSVIDFTSTNPVIPDYKDYFAAVIDNFLTEAECVELLALAEMSAVSTGLEPWERAMINVGNGEQTMAIDIRNCGRIMWDSPQVADRILARLMPFLKQWDIVNLRNHPTATGLTGRKYECVLSRLNERLRFLKYVGGEYFRPHYDGSYRTPDGSEMSFYTIHLYLNGDGGEEQDMETLRQMQEIERRTDMVEVVEGKERGSGKLLGGATSFMSSWLDTEQAVRVWPKTGRVLVFQHNGLLHGGDSVYGGTKFTIRTDIMYSKTPLNKE